MRIWAGRIRSGMQHHLKHAGRLKPSGGGHNLGSDQLLGLAPQVRQAQREDCRPSATAQRGSVASEQRGGEASAAEDGPPTRRRRGC
jgi:hypothetical protein